MMRFAEEEAAATTVSKLVAVMKEKAARVRRIKTGCSANIVALRISVIMTERRLVRLGRSRSWVCLLLPAAEPNLGARGRLAGP